MARATAHRNAFRPPPYRITKLLHDTIAADRPAGGCTPSTSRRALLAFGRRGGRAAVSEQHVDHPKSEKGIEPSCPINIKL